MKVLRSIIASLPILFLPLALVSCQSNSKKRSDTIGSLPSRTSPNGGAVSPSGPLLDVKSPANVGAMILAKPVTSLGKNSEGRFSPDGRRLLFISRERPSHRQAQVYELDLSLMTEKRITFHDGDDSGAIYAPGSDEILYASSTDEGKEEPALSRHLMRSYLPEAKTESDHEIAELYRQKLNGQNLERLTTATGFDGDASIDADGRIIFTSSRDGKPNLYLANGTTLTRVTEGAFRDEGARFSPSSDALVWSRKAADGKTAQLMIAEGGQLKEARALTPFGSLDLQPTWSPNGDEILFSSTRGSSSGFFNLYAIDRKGLCLKRLTEVSASQLHPSLSPDGKQLAFTLLREGQSQIYVMDYRAGTNCLPQ